MLPEILKVALEEIATGGGINCRPDGITGTVSKKWSKGTGGPAGDEHYNLICTPNDETAPCLTKEHSEQTGQDSGQPGMLVNVTINSDGNIGGGIRNHNGPVGTMMSRDYKGTNGHLTNVDNLIVLETNSDRPGGF